MLDLDHPLTKHIFAAARAEGAILTAARDMTVASLRERERLKNSCDEHLFALRRLAAQEFADKPAIPKAIDQLQRSLETLATLQNVPQDGPPQERRCPSCNAKLERRDRFGIRVYFRKPTLIYCSVCLAIIMPSLSILESCEEGFGTDAI